MARRHRNQNQNQSNRPQQIYVDQDVLRTGELDSIKAWMDDSLELVDEHSEDALNFSAASEFEGLDDDERPPCAFFDIQLLRMMVNRAIEEFDVDYFSRFVISPGIYAGEEYFMPMGESPTRRLAPLSTQGTAAIERQDQQKRQQPPGDYTPLEEAFLLTALYHPEAALYNRSVITQCIYQTLAVLSRSTDNLYPRTYTSIHEKTRAMLQRLASLSSMQLALRKKPIASYPKIMKHFFAKLEEFSKGKLDTGGRNLMPFLNRRDLQTMLTTCQWEYPPGTNDKSISRDFYAYYGAIHNGKTIICTDKHGSDTWLEFFRRRVVPKPQGDDAKTAARKEQVVGKYWADFQSSGFGQSDLVTHARNANGESRNDDTEDAQDSFELMFQDDHANKKRKK